MRRASGPTPDSPWISRLATETCSELVGLSDQIHRWERGPVVYVDRRYVDATDGVPPWHRLSRTARESEWVAFLDSGVQETCDSQDFASIDPALDWARERAEQVMVRLGTTDDHYFSAGRRAATYRLGPSVSDYPPWPPPGWPVDAPVADT